ncbi:hypothetical protein [Streptomyces sp. NPDC049881]|uniref:hypothetical protein n=1 Tax=Streptomyces sp. NPDC049881 TaxID=3155778 RepID=UPI003439E8F2
MVFVRTTPPRSVDVAVVFPELAPLARETIRLHPRPGAPSVGDSSVGGPLLWPAGEPWPHCEEEHVDSGFRTSLAQARHLVRVFARRHADPDGPAFTPEESAVRDRLAVQYTERLDAGPLPSEQPVPLLPVAQLYLRDIPVLRPPGQADVLQVLWCPYEHESYPKPLTRVFWRSAADVTDVLAAPPEPFEVENDDYVPVPCLLAPEAITDYPHSYEVDPEIQAALEDWDRWLTAEAGVSPEAREMLEEWRRRQEAGERVYESYEPRVFYDECLGEAPGWKVGGWPPWGRTDPYPQSCTVCDARMVPLLTIASYEWDGGAARSWAPQEEHAAAYADSHRAGNDPSQPTQVQVGSTDNMQLYICPTSPDHPHTDLIQ